MLNILSEEKHVSTNNLKLIKALCAGFTFTILFISRLYTVFILCYTHICLFSYWNFQTMSFHQFLIEAQKALPWFDLCKECIR